MQSFIESSEKYRCCLRAVGALTIRSAYSSFRQTITKDWYHPLLNQKWTDKKIASKNSPTPETKNLPVLYKIRRIQYGRITIYTNQWVSSGRNSVIEFNIFITHFTGYRNTFDAGRL